MTTLAVIPAKGASLRVRNKNTRLLGGRPLLFWTIDAALQARSLTRIAVSTESQDIADLVAGTYGNAVTVVRRPEELAADDVPASAAVLHAVDWLGWDGDAVAMLLPTSPFRTAAQIDEACALQRSWGQTCLSVSGADLRRRLRYVDATHITAPIVGVVRESRTDYGVVLSNGAIQVSTPGILRARNGFPVGGSVAFVMDPITGLDIDEDWQWAVAEWVVATGRHLIPVMEEAA